MDFLITVLVVDPWRIIREGIRTLIDKEPDIEVIGAAGTGEETIQIVEELQPDVVVMDVELPDLKAIKTRSIIREVNPDTRVIYLTDKQDSDMIFQGILKWGGWFSC